MKEISDIILKYIFDENTYFIFPTEIAADLWLEKIITDSFEKNLPYPKALPKERFMSWDKFKTSSIKSTRQDKDIIPSIMRKIFAINIIEKNKNLIKNNEKPLFQELISTEYAEFSQSFANWIVKILPQLALWKKKYFLKKTREEASPIEEDYFALYEEYASFLEENNLFDSAWETPPFADEGKNYIIFFPESLSDFEEYKELLSSSSHIKLITLEKLQSGEKSFEKPKAKFFENSAQEIHQLMLFIKKSHEIDNIPYEKMAISLTDSDNFLPYIQRELEKYGIPYTTRIGKSMGKYLSGRLFTSLKDCYESGFSFASIQNLLTNESLLWKNPGLNQGLINFGIKNNCLCSFDENGQTKYPFDMAFEKVDNENKVKQYYIILRDKILALCHSASFKELLGNYWKFRTYFFEEINLENQDSPVSELQKETNDILGRIVSELSILLSLEEDKNFFGLTLPSCFDFFVDYITEKEYLAKPKNWGVGIYPYRVAAAAPFDLHIIPNATQKNLSVVFPRLSFMPKNLKNQFEVVDSDISAVYLEMYLRNSYKSSYFSASTFSYSGYSIIHSLLDEEKAEQIQDLGIYDIVQGEKDFWLGKKEKLDKITARQKSNFENWKMTSQDALLSTGTINEETQKLIDNYFISGNKVIISATSMKSFYECPKKMLFGNILGIYNEREKAELSSLDTGKILHKVLELYFNKYKKAEIVDFQVLDDGEKLVSALLNQVVSEYDSNFINKKILETQKIEIHKKLVEFLKDFTQKYAGFKVYETEYSLTKKLEFEDASKNPNLPLDVYITGIIDLVLAKDEDLYIVDYKSKKTPTIKACLIGKNGEDPSDFQLALYTYLLEKTKEKVKVQQSGFTSIEDGKETKIYSSGKMDREAFQPVLERVQEMAFDFGKAILEKNLGLPTMKILGDCNKCSYKKNCRALYAVSGRKKNTGEEK